MPIDVRPAVLSFIMTLATFSSFSQQKKPQTEKLPNIIYIYADDMGYGELCLHGSFWHQSLVSPESSSNPN